MVSNSSIGQYLRQKRREAGLTLREVASSIGVSEVFLGEVERGVRPSVKPERLLQLQEAVPGFSATEAEARLVGSRAMKLDLRDAPPEYQQLGVALARRIDRRDIPVRDLEDLMRILRGGDDDD
jgi:transcriptional regulator with XRE-family HTH domain